MMPVYREHWRHVRWADAIPILKAIYRGRITSPSGKGAVEVFEKSFSDFCGTKFSLAMNSGTAALHSALFAVGVEPGDEVILPSYTWHATAAAVLCCGGTPVFCDINRNTLTMDPADVEKKITPKTKVLLPVHVWGNPCEMDKILEIAKKHNLRVVEDCSHAHGAVYKGRPVGSWGDIGAFSLQGGKPVSAGEGGIAVCSDPIYFDRMLALGHPIRTADGMKSGTLQLEGMNLGPKYRPHLFSILLAQESLKRLPVLNTLRKKNWEYLSSRIQKIEGVKPLESCSGANMSGFYEFKLILSIEKFKNGRTGFVAAAKEQGIPLSEDRYGFLHEKSVFYQPAFLTIKKPNLPVEIKNENGLVNTHWLRERIVTLPAFSKVSMQWLNHCIQGLDKISKDLLIR